MNEPEPILVGVDFTPSVLRIMLGTVDGEIVFRQDYPMPVIDDEDAWAWEVGGRISTAFAAEGERRWALGIGIACPGVVDTATGVLLDSIIAPEWEGLHVVEALRRHIDAPAVAISRTEAALRGEAASGAAAGTFEALYISLDDGPTAAILSSGRILAGAHHRAGSLPGFPVLTEGTALSGDELDQGLAVLADVIGVLDPALVIVHGRSEHATPLLAALPGLIDEVGSAADATAAALGDYAALLGAFQAASIVAYEGERVDDES